MKIQQNSGGFGCFLQEYVRKMQESVFEVGVAATGDAELILCISNGTPLQGLCMGRWPCIISIIPSPSSMVQLTDTSLVCRVSSALPPNAQIVAVVHSLSCVLLFATP